MFMVVAAVGYSNECSSSGERPPSIDVSESVVSLLQAKVQINTLEEGVQDRSQPSLPTIREEGVDPSAGVIWETLFIVLSDSLHYSENLKWISDSWGTDLPPSQLLVIGDEANNNRTSMRVEPTTCTAHSQYGVCCKAAEAIITGHRMLEEQPNLQWLYIIEDDAYVRPMMVDRKLKHVDPVGVNSRGTLIAVSGVCGEFECQSGVCGAGGIALSRVALMTLVGDNPSKYRNDHMKTCKICGGERGDETIGAQARARNINIQKEEPTTMGIYGWTLFRHEFDESLTSDVVPLMYHPMKSEGRFKFLHKLFAKEYKSIGDAHSSYCASYTGSTVCTSDSLDMPFQGGL